MGGPLDWIRERLDGVSHEHAAPDIERASAELYGKVEMILDEFERMVAERERELDDGDEG